MHKVFRELLLFGSVVGISLSPFTLVQASHEEGRLDHVGYRSAPHVQVNPASYYNNGRHSSYPDQRYRRHHYGSNDCHSVSKQDYDRYGYPVRIGGTMCYDHNGNSYVVPGSRYIIERY